jgi:hypothetical protein
MNQPAARPSALLSSSKGERLTAERDRQPDNDTSGVDPLGDRICSLLTIVYKRDEPGADEHGHEEPRLEEEVGEHE